MTHLEDLWTTGPAGSSPPVVLKYQPLKSCVLRYDLTHGTPVYAKLSAEPHGERAFRCQSLLKRLQDAGGAHPPIRVSAPIRYDQKHRVLWQRHAPGAAIDCAALTAKPLKIAEQAASALVTIHGSELVSDGEVPSVSRRLRDSEKRLDRLQMLTPELRPALNGCRALLHRFKREPNADACTTVHGDFHIHQMLFDTADNLWLVDFDSLRRGIPESDVAEFIASLIALGAPVATVRIKLERIIELWQREMRRTLDREILQAFTYAEVIDRNFRILQKLLPGWRNDLRQAFARIEQVAELFV